MIAAIVIIALVAGSAALGLLWRRGQGRVRVADGQAVVLANEIPGAQRLADGATLLQFSTELCAQCVPTRALLGEIAAAHGNVTHIDLDLTHRPDLANRFNIMQTPTTLILDRWGVVRARIGGPPRRQQLRDELTRILEAA